LERWNSTKGLRIDFAWGGHPIDGDAICEAVYAHALMSFSDGVWRAFLEPQDRSSLGFRDNDEAAFASGDLERLKSLHNPFL